MKILVTGANGFVGKNLVRILKQYGYTNLLLPTSRELNLLNQNKVLSYMVEHEPEVVINLAATCGGIGANKKRPATFMYNNLQMGLNLIEGSRYISVEKFVQLGSVCSYPKYTAVPFKEEDIWNGYPEETNAPYGIAKKTLSHMITCYHQEFDFPGVNLMPANMYGPHDHFDLENSHVIPALIRKFYTAKIKDEASVEIWGTGTATRDFLYVDDCCEAIVTAMEDCRTPLPINIGTGVETSIMDIVDIIMETVEYTGDVVVDQGKPDGQPRRCLSTKRAEKWLGFRAPTNIDYGLTKTIKWYIQNEAKNHLP